MKRQARSMMARPTSVARQAAESIVCSAIASNSENLQRYYNLVLKFILYRNCALSDKFIFYL